MNADELKLILDDHAKWLRNEGGKRADLSRANLCMANLSEANLCMANLCMANLYEADLSRASLCMANLSEADLSSASLYRADLSRANLCMANLSEANLSRANLSEADLSRASLSEANLSRASLCMANLYRADLSEAAALPAYQICEGVLSVWKKASRCVVNLEIPAEAKRTASLVSRKCRAEYAKVAAIFDAEGDPVNSVSGDYDEEIIYTVGEIVRPDSYNDDPRIECTNGIHFFRTRKEAEDYA